MRATVLPRPRRLRLGQSNDQDGKVTREGCEVDHLVSRELGGADALPNLLVRFGITSVGHPSPVHKIPRHHHATR